MNGVLTVLSGTLLIGGALLSLAASIGLLRFPDVAARIHAATKPQVLGLLLFLSGLALRLQSGTELATLLMVAVFQMATAPVAAHIIGRAAYRADLVRRDLLVTDEADGITTGATGGDGTGGQRRATI
ncbi:MULTISPECIES: monovalent cation/H(+) antiporter subunit G [unclassified Solwaraspora]|uniref:monovalent cation/H(+) antiporter subunit G n=1 Tax=unclassified Solwaraspora TaxID=2627926 RepID=UPI00248B3CF0|nr:MULTISPECIES: monovalent cation/H(+) antiporter subunit G [unclassified Solwaraspora]WBB98640.1 monovalent cation/H(+) antiporter subunit G [Solwaraspora sp. WMMA2059]WBC22808.1 monovalent cation/H(+) antiporter subunit G [Solwaraspora sp. WMMA2080]WJK35151.1 monovalent cation/H(+) antiporter subunit G [Solwaraspora sp. WMMA2065]